MEEVKNKNMDVITKKNVKNLASSISITNIPEVLKWIVENQTNSYYKNKKSISSNLLNEFKILFDKPNKSLRLKYLTKVYILKYNGLVFNVFISKDGGTGIEICDVSYENLKNIDKEIIISFLEKLHKDINSFN
jgi:hypothetical protein